MFDVPVLDVTVSSAPTMIDSVGTINKIAALSSTPQISSALLNAAALLHGSVSVPPSMTDTTEPHRVRPVSTALLSTSAFQSLEPLNLADTAESLDKVFTLSVAATGSASTLLPQPAEPQDPPVVSLLPPATATILNTENLGEPPQAGRSEPEATEAAEAPKTVAVRSELSQCIDGPQPLQGITTFQVWHQGTVLGEISGEADSKQLVRSLQFMLTPDQLDARAIVPVLGGEQPAIRLGDDTLMHVAHQTTKETDTAAENASSEWAAIAWSDQLRQNLGAAPLDAGDVQMLLKGLQITEKQLGGLASWYGPYFHGRLTANGETFDQNALTAAHKSLPFDTVLRVRNLKNNRSVVVRINDRGPYIGKRSLDLSKAAAQCLDSEQTGVIPYEAAILE